MGGKILDLLQRFMGLLQRWGSGGFGSALSWLALVLLGVGYVICGSAGW
jgi:hypothetical protein